MKKEENNIKKVNSWAHNNTTEFASNVFDVDGHRNRVQCPFHSSQDYDMGYNPKTGLWKCFGQCNTTFGDSVTVATIINNDLAVEEWRNKSVKEKMKLKHTTAEKINKEHETGQYEPIKFSEKRDITSISTTTSNSSWELNFPGLAILYKEKFLENKSAEFAVKHFFENFDIDDNWDRFEYETKKLFKVYSPKKNAPLFLKNFRFYILHNENGKILSFQGRRNDDMKLPDFMKNIKMYNLPDTPIEKIVYGLWAIRTGRTHNTTLKEEGDWKHYVNALLIHEGPGDVLRTYENGFPSVALLGKEMNEFQAKKIAENVEKEVIIMFDNDKAGRKASKKVKETLKEANQKLKISTAWLPKGIDPGEANQKQLIEAIKKRF